MTVRGGNCLLTRATVQQVSCLEREEKRMKDVIREGGQTWGGRTAVTFERETTTMVFKAVPAEICTNCGEAYVAEEVSRQILAAAELAARSGVQVDLRKFVETAR